VDGVEIVVGVVGIEVGVVCVVEKFGTTDWNCPINV
jgi:hypothetical protein